MVCRLNRAQRCGAPHPPLQVMADERLDDLHAEALDYCEQWAREGRHVLAANAAGRVVRIGHERRRRARRRSA